MKIECEVIGVETIGDGIKVLMQGKPPGAAEWRPLKMQTFIVPSDGPNKTFYVGRKVQITIKPK